MTDEPTRTSSRESKEWHQTYCFHLNEYPNYLLWKRWPLGFISSHYIELQLEKMSKLMQAQAQNLDDKLVILAMPILHARLM